VFKAQVSCHTQEGVSHKVDGVVRIDEDSEGASSSIFVWQCWPAERAPSRHASDGQACAVGEGSRQIGGMQ
jgi:hypothetical protein